LPAPGEPRALWVETDPGGYPDDAYALAVLLDTPGVELVGIGTTGGHGALRAGWVQALLAAAGRSVPVYAGPESPPAAPVPAQLGAATAAAAHDPARAPPRAADGLTRALEARPGEISILLLGPATNLARAEERRPGILGAAAEVVIMGGAFEVGYDGRAPVAREANVAADPDAFRRVLEAAPAPLVVPLDATWSTTLPEALRSWLDASPDPEVRGALGAFLADQYRRSETDWGADHQPVLHDVVATEVLVHPEAAEVERVRVRVTPDGRVALDPDGVAVRRVTAVSPARVVAGLGRAFGRPDPRER
jgi:inosine-uridine nucleoside N-ribohydrolase